MRRSLLKIALFLLVLAGTALTVFWFSRPADISFEQARANVPHAEYSNFAVIDGVRIHYQEKGSGAPLVLIHGFSSSTYSWKDVFDPLSKNFRVIAVDLKGFGFSAKPDGDYTRRAQAVLVTHLLDYLKIDKAWLAGNSMGGEVALNVALQSPQRVAGLVLIDSAGVTVSGSGSLAPGYLLVPVVGRIVTAFALRSDKLVRQGLEKSYYDDTKITADRVAAYYRPLQSRAGQMAALRARTQAGQLPIEQEIPEVSAPTLILWGAQDELIPVEAGITMNKLIKSSKLVIFDNCGHVPQEELPEKVAHEMVAFMQGSQPAKQKP